jgi:hypothetical protein
VEWTDGARVWCRLTRARPFSSIGRQGQKDCVIGLLLYGLSDEGVSERWVYDPYFQHFTGEEFPHERSDLSHWRKRLGGKLGGSDAIDRNGRPASFRCAGRRPCLAPLPRDHPGRHMSRSIS